MSLMPITQIRLERFTAFESLDLRPSPGINVFLGANGAGKTHIMKVAYAACGSRGADTPFHDKLVRLFLPSGRNIGRMVKRRRGSADATVRVEWEDSSVRTRFTRRTGSTPTTRFSRRTRSPSPTEVREPGKEGQLGSSAYIPVKEMLANAPGFLSLYRMREAHFEEVYADILDRAFLPPLRGAPDRARRQLLDVLQEVLGGEVFHEGEEFFLRSRQGKLEFTLLAEGLRKLGLLWLLIQNGTLTKGSILFWDEPETNLNPGLFMPIIEILLALQRQGVQIFIATHDYLILKLLDVLKKPKDEVAWHALERGEDGELTCNTEDSWLAVKPNAILETFSQVWDLDIRRSLGVSR